GPSGFDVGGDQGVEDHATLTMVFLDVTKLANGYSTAALVRATSVQIVDPTGTQYSKGHYLATISEYTRASQGDPTAHSVDFQATQTNDLAVYVGMANYDKTMPLPDHTIYEMPV